MKSIVFLVAMCATCQSKIFSDELRSRLVVISTDSEDAIDNSVPVVVEHDNDHPRLSLNRLEELLLEQDGELVLIRARRTARNYYHRHHMYDHHHSSDSYSKNDRDQQ